MPRSPIEKKRRYYNNGPSNQYKPAKWEQNGYYVSPPRNKHERRGERGVDTVRRGR